MGYAADHLHADRQVVLAALNACPHALQLVLRDYSNGREIILKACKGFGDNLWFASDALRNDREIIVLAAVRDSGNAFQLASVALRNDAEFVLEAVQYNGMALSGALGALRNDREIVLTAVQNNGLALQFASASLRNDREIALLAAARNRDALPFASNAVKNDPDVVAAVLGTTNFVDSRQRISRIVFCGASIKQRLVSVVSSLEILHYEDIDFLDAPSALYGTAVCDLAEHVKKNTYEKIWMLTSAALLDAGPNRLILEYASVKDECQLIQNLVHLAPVLAALAKHGINWDLLLRMCKS